MQKRILKITLICILLIVLPLPLIYLLNTELIDNLKNLVIYDLGIVAYVWWLAIIYLSLRPKWLANLIGIPSIYMLHGIVAVLALLVATIHKFSSNTFHAIIKNTGNIAWYLEIFLLIYAIMFLSGWITDHISWARKLKKKVELVLKHEVSVWIHRLNFIVIALIWIHVHVIPRINNLPYFSIIFDTYTAVFVLLYCYKKFIVDVEPKNQGKILVNEPLTTNIQKLVIQLNKNSESYKAGDLYFISFKNKKHFTQPHPFSVANKPKKNQLTVIVHKVGDFTKIIEHFSVGSAVRLQGPYGLFSREVERSSGPIILYGLGTGIAPLLSLAVGFIQSKQVHLIWSTASEENYFTKEIRSLKRRGLKLNIQQHRFSEEELNQILTLNEKENGDFFIVGSSPVVLKVKRNLRLLGIKRRQLHDEHLTM